MLDEGAALKVLAFLVFLKVYDVFIKAFFWAESCMQHSDTEKVILILVLLM